MSKRKPSSRGRTVRDFVEVMETIAPTALAQSWDNVGLIAGDPDAALRTVLTCIDLTPDVAKEAIRIKADLVLAYHPPIFKPIGSLRADSDGTDAVVYQCIRHGLNIYTTHTALDAADGGTNDVIATLCGADQTEPIEYVDQPGAQEFKLVVFVPSKSLEKVAAAMFDAGAGRIGDYTHCSYRSAGRGTFYGGDSTNPAVGRKGRLQFVDETRLETVVPSAKLPAVVKAMIAANPYEEPAFDIYPLKPSPVRGIGRIAGLKRATTLSSLARKLKRATGSPCTQIVGAPDAKVNRVVVVVGAAGDLPLRAGLTRSDAVITGEIRHHDALMFQRIGCGAIALGHWSSERPVLASLSRRIKEALPGVSVRISKRDREPFQPV